MCKIKPNRVGDDAALSKLELSAIARGTQWTIELPDFAQLANYTPLGPVDIVRHPFYSTSDRREHSP
jgi:hypothetical protein